MRTYYVLQPEFLIQNLPSNLHPDNAEKLPGDFSLSPSFFCPQIHAVPNHLRMGAKGAHFHTTDQDKEVRPNVLPAAEGKGVFHCMASLEGSR